MGFSVAALDLGRLYTRPGLAELWGYAGHEAISKGVFTPKGGGYIVLFVTRQKQKALTQYHDFINGDILHWEGEKGHGNDARIARSAETGEEIHLFYRDIHHTPFRYYGPILITSFIARKEKPSQFVFSLLHDLGPDDDLKQSAKELEAVGPTEREALVRARVGQGVFRESLLELWGGCAVTGVDRPDLLRASHIKPWRASDNAERLSRFNGLLLIPQYDHLFDRGYITFDVNGQVEVSPAIVALPPERIGVAMSARLLKVAEEQIEFLNYHRSEVFLKRLTKE